MEHYAAKYRRVLLKAAGVALIAPVTNSLAALQPTPRQSTGPFYPVKLPLDADADLVQVAGKSRPATGIVSHLTGVVVDINGTPIAGAKFEIWQCDAFGAYLHPRDRGGISEPEFQGYGFTTTTKMGEFRFRTIRPVSYPGRTPHIHARVTAPGMPALITQLYITDEPQNAEDFLFRRIPENLRSLVTAPFPTSAEESETVIPQYTVILS